MGLVLSIPVSFNSFFKLAYVNSFNAFKQVIVDTRGNVDEVMRIGNMIIAEAASWSCFCKKGVLKNFAKFTGKHLCQSLFFNKVSGLRLANLLEKRLWHSCFPVKFAKNTFFTPQNDCF